MSSVRDDVETAARTIRSEGFLYSEAYPIERWRAHGWPEARVFFRAVDSLIAYHVKLELYESWHRTMMTTGSSQTK